LRSVDLPVRFLRTALISTVVIFIASTLPGVRPRVGFSGLLDGLVQLTGYVLVAALAILRASRSRDDRTLWALVASALTFRAVGFILYVAVVRTTDPLPYPSIADVSWLFSTILLISAVVVALRRRSTERSVPLVLDGSVVALTVGAFAGALLFETLVASAGVGSGAAVAANLAYPLLDIVAVTVGGGLLLSYNWVPPPSMRALVVGVVGISLVDCIFVLQLAAGTFRPGTLLPAASLAATAVIGWSGWLEDRPAPPPSPDELPRVIVPAASAIACAMLLASASRQSLSVGTVTSAASAIVLALARTAHTFQHVRALAIHQRHAVEAERRFRAVVDASPDAILGVGPTGAVVFANDHARVVLGAGPDRLEGTCVDDLVHPPLGAMCRALLDHEHRTAVTARPSMMTVETVKGDSKPIPLEVRLTAVDVSGTRVVLLTARDVSDRLELEAERRRRSQEAEQALSDRLSSQRQLASGVVHDFSNVLGVILSYAELAERRTTVQAMSGDIAVIRTAAQQGVSLTDQLLAFAREEPADRSPVDVDELVRSAVRMIEPKLPKGVHVRTEHAGGAGEVTVVRHQLERVLLNLALNALDAMPKGGLLTIRTEGCVDHVAVLVSDTGHGMAEEVRSRAFEPFFTTKVRGDGSGLGLATVHGIVVSHGGLVEIDSNPGAGTTVRFVLPRSRQPARSSIAPPLE